MSNYPLIYSKKSDFKKENHNLVSYLNLNFNNLNYPINLKIKNEDNNFEIKSPLKSTNGQPIFYGYLNEKINQIEIYDDCVLLLLYWLGNYGNNYFLNNFFIKKFKFNEIKSYERKIRQELINKQNDVSSNSFSRLNNPSNLFELNQDNYRHNLYLDSLNELKNELGELNLNELINQMFKINLENDNLNNKNCKLNKIKFNSFESTFNLISNCFNQNFIEHEEYILKLDLEEAFYLKHVFGILSINELIKDNNLNKEDNNLNKEDNVKIKQFKNINLINLWSKFIELRESINQCFITKYAAYYYFRSKGFIVKDGSKFGSDFVLYSKNPIFVHSNYSILLIKKSSESKFNQLLKLTNIQAFIRMTKCVIKVPILCIVTFPSNLTQAELKTPELIKKLKIKCLLMDRFISSIERENNKNMNG